MFVWVIVCGMLWFDGEGGLLEDFLVNLWLFELSLLLFIEDEVVVDILMFMFE